MEAEGSSCIRASPSDAGEVVRQRKHCVACSSWAPVAPKALPRRIDLLPPRRRLPLLRFPLSGLPVFATCAKFVHHHRTIVLKAEAILSARNDRTTG